MGQPDRFPPTGFGALVRRCRIDRRLTQEQLADATGLSVRTISNIERGRVRYPRPGTARLLAAGLRLAGAEAAAFDDRARSDYWDVRGARPGPTPGPGPAPADRLRSTTAAVSGTSRGTGSSGGPA